MPFANRMHDFNPRNRATGSPKRLEAQHGMKNPFDCSMILLNEVVEILGLTDLDGRLVDLVVVTNGSCVAPTLINDDGRRHPMRTDRPV